MERELLRVSTVTALCALHLMLLTFYGGTLVVLFGSFINPSGPGWPFNPSLACLYGAVRFSSHDGFNVVLVVAGFCVFVLVVGNCTDLCLNYQLIMLGLWSSWMGYRLLRCLFCHVPMVVWCGLDFSPHSNDI